MTAIEKAVSAAGSQAALGRALQVSQQRVNYWVDTGKVPAEFVLPIEAATGVTRYELRPDLYPVEDFDDVSDTATVGEQ